MLMLNKSHENRNKHFYFHKNEALSGQSGASYNMDTVVTINHSSILSLVYSVLLSSVAVAADVNAIFG